MNIYLIKAYFEDDAYLETHLCLTSDEAISVKEDLFKAGAAEIRIEKWVSSGNNSLIQEKDFFFGYNPYNLEELEDFMEEG